MTGVEDGGKIDINLAGQPFRIAPPQGDATRLRRAAAIVCDKVREIEKAGVVATNRSALLAALEIALELLEVRESPSGLSDGDVAAGRGRLEAMIARIDQELAT